MRYYGFSAALLAISAFAAHGPAAAAPNSSSGVYGVVASCPAIGDYYYNPATRSFCATPAGAVLGGGTPVPGEEVEEAYPGSFTSVPTSLSLVLSDGETAAAGYAELTGDFELPKLAAVVAAGRYGVAYISAGGARKYLYSGDEMALPIDALLTYAFLDGVAAPVIQPSLTAKLIIYDGNWLPTSTIDFDAPPIACGSDNVLAFSSFVTNSGSAGAINLTNDCNGNPFTVRNGDSFWVVASLDVLAHRGGLVDAGHTMVVDVGSGLDAAAREQLLSTLSPLQGVPEPASWAMLIAGFGLTGAAMRRRREAIA